MDKWHIYIKIKQLRELKYSERKIATKLGISRTTVTKYLKKNPEEVALWLASTKRRTKKLDQYQKEILDWLRKYPDTSAAIIHDRLEEKYPDFSVAESTVRVYINDFIFVSSKVSHLSIDKYIGESCLVIQLLQRLY